MHEFNYEIILAMLTLQIDNRIKLYQEELYTDLPNECVLLVSLQHPRIKKEHALEKS